MKTENAFDSMETEIKSKIKPEQQDERDSWETCYECGEPIAEKDIVGADYHTYCSERCEQADAENMQEKLADDAESK